MQINRNTIYNWLWKRESERQAARAAGAGAEEGCPSPAIG